MNTTDTIEFTQIDDEVELGFIADKQTLPLVITAKNATCDLVAWGKKNKASIQSLSNCYGGILFRGFGVNSSEIFEKFIASISSSALEYMEQSSPRSNISGNIFTSTDHPKDKEILLHSEQSYNLNFPMKIFFYCEQPATTGGHTIIADARKIYQRIDASIRKTFLEKKYLFSRCFWPLMGMTWQKAFQTSDKYIVEKYCDENEISFQWMEGDALKTDQIRSCIARHPDTKELCWFNHCTFFNLTSLEQESQEILRHSFPIEKMPNHTFYGDGSEISSQVMEHLRNAYQAEKVIFHWQKGDILMLDNMLTAHGRSAFEGERSVLVGMSELNSWQNAEYKNEATHASLVCAFPNWISAN